MMTAACAPEAGWMNAASHVPSGVLMATVFSTTCCWAEAPAAAAAMPPTVAETKVRRVMSSLLIGASSCRADDSLRDGRLPLATAGSRCGHGRRGQPLFEYVCHEGN